MNIDVTSENEVSEYNRFSSLIYVISGMKTKSWTHFYFLYEILAPVRREKGYDLCR